MPLPTGRKLYALDAAVVGWVLVWVVLGVIVGDSVAALTGLTSAFRSVGGAIGGVGQALTSIDVPLIATTLDRAGEAVQAAGRDVIARGTAVRGDIIEASVVLGAAVALAPTLPVLALYGAPRLARARDAAAVRAFVEEARSDPGLESFLAARALRSVPYRRLRALAVRPWNDERATRRALAEEELRRLGLPRSSLERGEG